MTRGEGIPQWHGSSGNAGTSTCGMAVMELLTAGTSATNVLLVEPISGEALALSEPPLPVGALAVRGGTSALGGGGGRGTHRLCLSPKIKWCFYMCFYGDGAL